MKLKKERRTSKETYAKLKKEEPQSIFAVKICRTGTLQLLGLYLPPLSDAVHLKIKVEQKCKTVSDFVPESRTD